MSTGTLLPIKSLVAYNVPPSLLCKGKESFPHGNGFGTGGRKNLLTDYRFSIYIAENENYIRCENVIS
ncbi:hypothetical protein, partial [Bacteroides gallinaceum]|uniref:hypothetical protein n=1 Tax=Bacteroides gallinaceum TaxID=1462571 RepID=UPI00195E86CA